jgi:hypothetical protein
MVSFWDFLKDAGNQAVLAWIGSGIAAAATGVRAIVKFRAKNGDHKTAPSVIADRGSIAAGNDVNINTRSSSKRSRK